ncbi:MBL fold metallo-hydrolase [Streptomyces marispadix]|uniref:MBL fold metallo-hydrolase n=1 Tax=Streptomyces marispadix TaxID=2922868 RepID=A0ABS9SRH4_9ACTN|nr:MBL fold metallo-hydrolase [Streptomyces marispadix]MCH6158876.1 MBL fold metallo-hydrolase [Streptomyces marispadix]
MRITVVGSGDAFGSGGRFQTCIALGPDDPAAASHTLLDCGATSAVALKQQGFDLNSIETILVTHLHADHFGGIPFLILDGQFRRRTRPLTVVGPPGTEQRLTEAMEVCFPGSSSVQRRFPVRVLEHQERTALPTERFTAIPYEVRHAAGAPSYAIRVADTDSAAQIAYSGDTEWTDALIDVSDDTDLFLCEGYAPHPVRWHLDLTTLADQHHRLKTQRLVLTHLSPTALTADLHSWNIAHDGLTLTV